METEYEIKIPLQLSDAIVQLAAETELSVEEIVEAAIKNYLERKQDNA